MTDVDLLVVGSGFFGLTVAERAAEELGLKVLVIDRRAHIGGNAYSEADPRPASRCTATARTCSTPRTRRCGSTSTASRPSPTYEHRVYTNYRGEVYPLPINLGTINQFFRSAHGPDEARALGRRAGSASSTPREAAEPRGEGRSR